MWTKDSRPSSCQVKQTNENKQTVPRQFFNTIFYLKTEFIKTNTGQAGHCFSHCPQKQQQSPPRAREVTTIIIVTSLTSWKRTGSNTQLLVSRQMKMAS